MRDREFLKGRRWLKLAALAALLCLALGLTACYIPPDEISNTQNMTVGSDTVPFDTVAPRTTSTPTPTPAQSTGQNTPDPLSTDDGWGTTIATNTPAPVITVITSPPSATPTVKATATPTPTTTSNALKKGATGTRVKEIQQRLKDLGYYKGSVDGNYGEGTESAVKAFQAAHGLTADGVVGDRTLSKLYASNAKPYSAANSTATPRTTARATARVTNTPRPTATPNLTKPTYLQLGSSGSKVKQLQQRLIDLGWMAGKADGEYGGATQAAVKAFQQKTSGLYADGIAGPETQASLYSASAARSSTVVSSTGETLRPGTEGAAVRALQKQLKALGYYKGSIDGSYGTATEEAVKAFQRNNKLTADGVAGTATLNKLYADNAIGSDGTSGSVDSEGRLVAAGESSTGFSTLRSGDTGAAVEDLQQQLKELGYYSAQVNGVYDRNTMDAVRAFQMSNGLAKVDGVAGNLTLQTLYSSSAKGASAPNTTYSTVRSGDMGDPVVELQDVLQQLGYMETVTGVYDSATVAAVKVFQRNNGLRVDGVAGAATQSVLYSSSPVPNY